ncbi:polysaccharide biosynthesis/export family protein [Flavobacteriaceae bacterium F89]|uniref:Polysaccharide biosynthesis/export family protein n=1 Tax=Cerina litoralis TaxID=2874477 RepID=A0AAE3JR64_9FLAO|nr:polysaccharide biosynthesis/export family protein [Cerina litoralis]MCG2462614.1 polysaccharide biosynthesis/export family protein [Cerina litoralis]
MKKNLLLLWIGILTLQSCASKKDIHYFQDADQVPPEVIYNQSNIQVNDILSILVTDLVPEAAEPYNISSIQGNSNLGSAEAQRLTGYLVDTDHTITFPVLGKIDVLEKTPPELEEYLRKLLKEGGHLKNPVVIVRIVNSKVTVLGEVKAPGTYDFSEQSINLTQALGYAGDLTINGIRSDIMVFREVNGKRTVGHIDMTTTDWFNSPYYQIKQNDVIVVQPNGPKVMTAGYIPNLGAYLGVFSLLLTTVLLITK